MTAPFTHLDDEGRLRMVDVSEKETTRRRAEASCVVRSVIDVFALEVTAQGLDPVFAARLAGIQAAKRTSQLIPLCHPINLTDVEVDITAREGGLVVHATVVTVNRTGIEMEALTACAFAAMSLVDVLTSFDPTAHVDELVLDRKSGGKSDDWGRLVAPETSPET